MTKRVAIELIERLAQQQGWGEHPPLLLLHPYEARPGARISHLRIHKELEEAWVKFTRSPFRPHQSLALSSLRRSEPFALMGGGSAARQTAHLMLLDVLLTEERARGLILLPDEATAAIAWEDLQHLARALDTPLPIAHVRMETPAREAATASILLTTPRVLHKRLLHHYDRAWQLFWRNLRVLVIAEMERYSGIAAAHLSRLLLRTTRLAPPESPVLIATLADVANAELTLSGISGEAWRIIPVDDTPRPASALAVWQAGNELLHQAATLALALQREGCSIHITCRTIEVSLVQAILGSQGTAITVGTVPAAAQVHIFAGYPGSPTVLRQTLESQSELVLLLLGTMPPERTLARLPEILLTDPAPAWALPPTNAYVAAQHLLCAAAERPLSTTEVLAWQASEMVARLERHHLLMRLPDDNAAWQPLGATSDPYDYDSFWLEAEGSSIVFLRDQHGTLLDMLDPAVFDRWGFLGAVLPPGRGGYRVVERQEEISTLTILADPTGRQTFPLRHCEINVRDDRTVRTVRGRTIGWGRVLIEEEIFGYREGQTEYVASDQEFLPSLTMRWGAPAIWIELPMRLKASGQGVGWSLVAALSLRVICNATDIVPAYDAGLSRLYLVDAQPGGNGLSAWIYENLESLLPLAYDIALDSRNDALLEPMARMDMDWLLTLLGGDVTLPEAEVISNPTPSESEATPHQPGVLPSTITLPSPSPTPDAPAEEASTPIASNAFEQQSAPTHVEAEEHGDGSSAPLQMLGEYQPVAATTAELRESLSAQIDGAMVAPRDDEILEEHSPSPAVNGEMIRPRTLTVTAQIASDEEGGAVLMETASASDPVLVVERDTTPIAAVEYVPVPEPLILIEQAPEQGQERGDEVPNLPEQPAAADVEPVLLAQQEEERLPSPATETLSPELEATPVNDTHSRSVKPAPTTNKRQRRTEGKRKHTSPAKKSREPERKDEEIVVQSPEVALEAARPSILPTPDSAAVSSEAISSLPSERVPDVSAHVTLPDVKAIMSRLQTMGKKRERPTPDPQPLSSSVQRDEGSCLEQPRFQVGDHISCLPYGYGVVRGSRIEAGQELLHVEFPDYGELDVDPSVSLVRLVRDDLR